MSRICFHIALLLLASLFAQACGSGRAEGEYIRKANFECRKFPFGRDVRGRGPAGDLQERIANPATYQRNAYSDLARRLERIPHPKYMSHSIQVYADSLRTRNEIQISAERHQNMVGRLSDDYYRYQAAVAQGRKAVGELGLGGECDALF